MTCTVSLCLTTLSRISPSGTLVKELRGMEREDAAVAVMCGAPLYQLAPPDEDTTSDSPPISSTSATSTSNLSR